jgi:hypothetical protein
MAVTSARRGVERLVVLATQQGHRGQDRRQPSRPPTASPEFA